MASAREHLLQNLRVRSRESIQLQEGPHPGPSNLPKETTEQTPNKLRKLVRNIFSGGPFRNLVTSSPAATVPSVSMQLSASRRLSPFEKLRKRFNADKQPKQSEVLPQADAIEVSLAKDRKDAQLALVSFLNSQLASDALAQELYLHPMTQLAQMKMLIVSFDPIGAELYQYLGPKPSSCRAVVKYQPRDGSAMDKTQISRLREILVEHIVALQRMSRGEGWYFHAVTDDIQEHLQVLYACRKEVETRLNGSRQRADALEASLNNSNAALRQSLQQIDYRDHIIEDLNDRVQELTGSLESYQDAYDRVAAECEDQKREIEEYENLHSAWADRQEECIQEVCELELKNEDLEQQLAERQSTAEECDRQNQELSRRLLEAQQELEQSRAELRIANDRLKSRDGEVRSLQQRLSDSEDVDAELRGRCDNDATRSEPVEQAGRESQSEHHAESYAALHNQGNGSDVLTSESPELFTNHYTGHMLQFGEAQPRNISPPATVEAQFHRRFLGPAVVPGIPFASARALDHTNTLGLETKSRFGNFFAGTQNAAASTPAGQRETSGLASWAQDFSPNRSENNLPSSSTYTGIVGTSQLPLASAHVSSHPGAHVPSNIDEYDDMYSATPEEVAARMNQRQVLAPMPVNGRSVDDLASRIAEWNRSPEINFTEREGMSFSAGNVTSMALIEVGDLAPNTEEGSQDTRCASAHNDGNDGTDSRSSAAEEDLASSAELTERPQSPSKTCRSEGDAPRAGLTSVLAESKAELVGKDKSESSIPKEPVVKSAEEKAVDFHGAQDISPDDAGTARGSDTEPLASVAESRSWNRNTAHKQDEPAQSIADRASTSQAPSSTPAITSPSPSAPSPPPSSSKPTVPRARRTTPPTPAPDVLSLPIPLTPSELLTTPVLAFTPPTSRHPLPLPPNTIFHPLPPTLATTVVAPGPSAQGRDLLCNFAHVAVAGSVVSVVAWGAVRCLQM